MCNIHTHTHTQKPSSNAWCLTFQAQVQSLVLFMVCLLDGLQFSCQQNKQGGHLHNSNWVSVHWRYYHEERMNRKKDRAGAATIQKCILSFASKCLVFYFFCFFCLLLHSSTPFGNSGLPYRISTASIMRVARKSAAKIFIKKKQNWETEKFMKDWKHKMKGGRKIMYLSWLPVVL